MRNELAKRIDIIGIMAHHIAVGMGIEIFDGELLHGLKHGVTHIAKRTLGNVRHNACPREVADKTREIDANKKNDGRRHLGHDLRKRGILAVNLKNIQTFFNIFGEFIGEKTADGVDHRADKKAYDNDDKRAFIILCYKAKHSAECTLFGFRSLVQGLTFFHLSSPPFTWDS